MWPKGSAPLSPHGGCSAQLLLTPADLEGVHVAHGRPPPQPLPRAFPPTGERQLWAGGQEGRRPPGTGGQGGTQLCGLREVSRPHHSDPHRGGSQGRACGPSACWEGRAGNCEVRGQDWLVPRSRAPISVPSPRAEAVLLQQLSP